MRCPYCENEDSKVIDSRHTEDGRAIRRRRECEACGRLRWLIWRESLTISNAVSII